MAAFKDNLNADLVMLMAKLLKQADDKFADEQFIAACIAPLEQLELKARSQHIARCLHDALALPFDQACLIIAKTLLPIEQINTSQNAAAKDIPAASEQGLAGWAIMPISDYIEQQGLDHAEAAFKLIRAITSRFSAEFCIRPFIENEREQSLAFIFELANSNNPHERRLASEGFRPRLPWGMRLHSCISDPSDNFKLLELLIDEQNRYVQTSIANHLNDLSKDHVDAVIAFCQQHWRTETKSMLSKGLRSLIKDGNQQALALIGYQGKVHFAKMEIAQTQLHVGETLEFNADITAEIGSYLAMDYKIHFVKANGKQSAKVFKWRKANITHKQTTFAGKQSFKEVTTRVLYPGEHKIELIVNGQSYGEQSFTLLAKCD